jgi:uncharacterized protein YjiS (DUF1127 family)
MVHHFLAMGRCKQRWTWKEERDGWMLLRATWKTVDLAWMSRSTRSRGWTLFSGWMSMAMKFHKCSEFDQMDFDDLDDCGISRAATSSARSRSFYNMSKCLSYKKCFGIPTRRHLLGETKDTLRLLCLKSACDRSRSMIALYKLFFPSFPKRLDS